MSFKQQQKDLQHPQETKEEIIQFAINSILKEVCRQNLLRDGPIAHYKDENKENKQKLIDSLIYTTMHKIIKEISLEAISLDNLATTLTEKVLFNAIRIKKKSENTEEKLRQLFYETRDPVTRLVRQDKLIELKFEDLSSKQKKQVNMVTKKGGGDDEDEDLDKKVMFIFPDKECVPQLGTKEIHNIEYDYFESFKVEEVPLFFPPIDNVKKERYLTCLMMDYRHEYLFASSSSGLILILNSDDQSFQRLTGCIQGNKEEVEIRHLAVSYDGLTQLIQVDDEGIAKILFNGQYLFTQQNESIMKIYQQNLMKKKLEAAGQKADLITKKQSVSQLTEQELDKQEAEEEEKDKIELEKQQDLPKDLEEEQQQLLTKKQPQQQSQKQNQNTGKQDSANKDQQQENNETKKDPEELKKQMNAKKQARTLKRETALHDFEKLMIEKDKLEKEQKRIQDLIGKHKFLATSNFFEYYRLKWNHLVRKNKRFVDEQQNLAISYAIFTPAITFSGIQPFILVGCENGTIMKYNSNKDMYQGLTYQYPIHRVVNSNILTEQDAEFPKEFPNVLNITENPKKLEQIKEIKKKNKQIQNQQQEEDDDKNNEQYEHVFREFFLEHKYKIVFLTFLQTPDSFVSIDSKGYIFLYDYDKSLYAINRGGYSPRQHLKISLETQVFKPTGDDVLLLPKEDMKAEEVIQEGLRYFKEILLQENFKKLRITDKIDEKGVITMQAFKTIPLEEVDKTVIIQDMLIDTKSKRLWKLIEKEYTSQQASGTIGKCIPINGNKQIVIQQIFPHKIKESLQYVQFVRLDTENMILKKTKILLEGPKLNEENKVDYTVIDNYKDFGLPYICVLMGQGIVIASLATGNIVQNIVEHFDIMKQSVCELITNQKDQAFFITCNSNEAIWKLKIKHEVNPELKDKVDKNKKALLELYNQ